MPDDAEIEMMLTDPVRWMQDYKVGQVLAGQFYRQLHGLADREHV